MKINPDKFDDFFSTFLLAFSCIGLIICLSVLIVQIIEIFVGC